MAIEIRQWLECLGLDRYADMFAENEINLAALPHITEHDLKEMGVALGARRQLLAAIAEMGTASESVPERQDADAPDAARRQVTALFADISGFTTLSSQLDAEETHALLNGFFAVVDDVVGSYGGCVDKHIGDAVMAVFGAPVAHTDDPERALRAALDIHRAVVQLNPPLRVHIGVASGQVVASSTGSAAHTEYTVTGDSVNLAARLTDLAKAGETLVSASVQRALGGRFAGVDLGERVIAGLPEPVAVWQLNELGAQRPDTSHAFVGRQRELRQFSAALEHCLKAGQGETVIVRGEAGIGKTRLVDEFANLANAKGVAAHTGLVLDFGTAKGQDAVRALVRSLPDLAPGSDKAVRAVAADQMISANQLPEARRVHLNDLLDLQQPPELDGIYQAMDNETRNRGKQDTVGILVRQASRSSPLLLRVEDAHWADPAILAHLTHLVQAIVDIPVLLIVTTRIAGDQLDQNWR
ncbi:MAG: AAA family ATPase, partial [Alphaproteobacteria bacterium]|nr:AAA family ATPase [Alphaproteobacteria bacterium]